MTSKLRLWTSESANGDLPKSLLRNARREEPRLGGRCASSATADTEL